MRSENRRIRNRIRRNRQLRRRIFITAAAICLFAMLGFSLGGFFSAAASDHDPVSYKYFSSVAVYPGDTLYSIARTYADLGVHYDSLDAYISELSAINHLQEDEQIRAGEYLIVPYYSTEFR